MRKLKLIRPWALSAVRQKLEAHTSFPGQNAMPAPAPAVTENIAVRHSLNEARRQPCAAPCEYSKRRSAPERRPIFAATAAPHPGCPHLYS